MMLSRLLKSLLLLFIASPSAFSQPSITINSTGTTYIENVTGFCFSASISNPDNDTTKVDVVWKSGSASLGSDFTITTTTLVFPPNYSGFKYGCIQVIDDTIVEPIENFVIAIRNPTNGAVMVDTTFSVTLWDNDSISPGVPCSDVLISEYIHSLSNGSKALEIFNPTSSTINLSGYNIRVYYNGDTLAGDSIPLSGTIPPNDVFVAAHPNSDSIVLAEADLLDAGLNWTGDDAVVLYNGMIAIDAVGIIGNDPGNSWVVGSSSRTSSRVIVRNSDVYYGEPNYYLGASRWTPYSQNTLNYIGNHAPLPCGFNGPTVDIVTQDADIIETPGISWSVHLINPNSDTTFVEVSLSPSSTVTASDHNFTSPVTLKFPPNTGGSQYVFVPLVDDNDAEALETMEFHISSVSNPAGYLLGDSTITLNIWDDDSIRDDNICFDLFISDYLHDIIGDSRAFEIFNPSPISVSLSGYTLEIYSPNNNVPDSIIHLSGILPADSTFVIARTNSHPFVLSEADLVTSKLAFSSRSSIVLKKNAIVLDAIGVPGSIPTSPSWPAGSGGTGTSGLYRIPDVQQGEPNYIYSAGNWIAYSQTDYSHLGTHNMYACGVGAPHVVSIVTADASFPEDIGALGISVGITNPDSVPITVQVSIDPSGTAGSSDASINPTTLTFPANSTSTQSIGISVVDDNIKEPNETFVVKISNPSGSNTLINDSIWVLTILDNDTAASITSIQLITTTDSNCVADSVGQTFTIQGVVETEAMAPGLDFFHMHDGSAGIWLFDLNSSVMGYTARRGDLIQTTGSLFQDHGNIFLNPDSITLLDSNQLTQSPQLVTGLDESMEAEIVKFVDGQLVDSAEWPNGNVKVAHQTDTVNLIIFSGSKFHGIPAPLYTFELIGVVLQQDTGWGCENYFIIPLAIDSTGPLAVYGEYSTSGLEVYPNPFRTEITITNRPSGSWSGEIFDLSGRIVYSIPDTDKTFVELNLISLDAGVYLLRVWQEGNSWIVRIIKE